MCIEYDGEQHYRPIDWFGGEKAYVKIKKRDDIKNNYCKENNIKIIRISFKNKNIIKALETIINKERGNE